MRKLVQINVAINKGSTGKIAEGIAQTAQKHGWECHIVHGARYVNPSSFFSYQVSTPMEERIHYAESLLFDRQGLGSKLATKRLINHLKIIKPDIIHLHNIHGCYLNYPILFGFIKSNNIPVVWTMHDCWSFTGHCAYFDAVGCNKWITCCNSCPQIRSFPKSLWLDRSNVNFNRKKAIYSDYEGLTLVPVSEWLGNLTKQSFLKDRTIHVIHNGIDLDLFKPSMSDIRAKYGIGGRFLVLGVADGFGERKGIRDFIKLSERLGTEYQIMMVGVEEHELKEIPTNIIALTRTKTQKELIDIYSSADVYINPTYEDNFPTTNIEALACGTPVITYQTGGSPEAIDNRTGIIIRQGDVDRLAEEIIQMREYPLCSAACRERAEELFDKNKCFEEYIHLYESILHFEHTNIS